MPKRTKRGSPAASRTSWATRGGSNGSGCTLQRSIALIGALLALALALTIFRPPPTQGPFGRDFEAYYAAGAVWNAGADPWSRDVWRVERTIDQVDASRDELLPYVGPAAALPLFGALARLPHSVAVRFWTALLVLALGALVAAALRMGTSRANAVTVVAAATLAVSAGPTTSAIALGQVALLSAAGIAVALVAYERRALVSGALATLVAGLQPNLALALVARIRDRSALLCASLGALAFAALTLAAGGGPAGFVRYLARLRAHGAAEAFTTIQHTPAAVALAFGVAPGVAALLAAAFAAAAVLAVIAATIRLRLDARDGALLAIAALPLAVPFFHEHDFTIELIPLLVLALRATGTVRALAGVSAALVLVDWFGLAQRPPAAAQIVLLGVAVAGAFAACGPRPRPHRADLAALATLACAACIAIPLARAFPAPTWPDALPPAYRTPASADASAVWSDEQRAAGLNARQPAWGALRALPLTGCVVLGVAIALAGRRSDVRVGE